MGVDKRKGCCFFTEFYGNDLAIMSFGHQDFATVQAYKLWRQGEEVSLHLVLKGKGTLTLGGNKYRISEKQVFCIPKNTPCKYYPDENDPWEYIWFTFKGPTDEILTKRAGFSFDEPVKTFDNFYAVKNETKTQIASLNNGYAGYLSVLGLLYRIIDLLSETPSGLYSDKTPNRLVFEMKRNIETCYVDAGFNVSLLCKMLYVSDAYASRLFKKTVGVTLKNYLTETRLKAAKKLLETTDSTVKEIARRVGYNDYTHFVKEFKRLTGINATEYRNTEYRNNIGKSNSEISD